MLVEHAIIMPIKSPNQRIVKEPQKNRWHVSAHMAYKKIGYELAAGRNIINPETPNNDCFKK